MRLVLDFVPRHSLQSRKDNFHLRNFSRLTWKERPIRIRAWQNLNEIRTFFLSVQRRNEYADTPRNFYRFLEVLVEDQQTVDHLPVLRVLLADGFDMYFEFRYLTVHPGRVGSTGSRDGGSGSISRYSILSILTGLSISTMAIIRSLEFPSVGGQAAEGWRVRPLLNLIPNTSLPSRKEDSHTEIFLPLDLKLKTKEN